MPIYFRTQVYSNEESARRIGVPVGVVEFHDLALNKMDFEAASKHCVPRHIQHNPNAPDGIEGFRQFIAMRKEKTPHAPIIDIFRLENGKIVEHRDVVQPIPEEPANDSGMFQAG